MIYTQYPSSLGLLTLTSDGYSLTGLWTENHRLSLSEATLDTTLPLFASVREWLDAYFHGIPRKIDFPLCPSGTDFQKQIWEILLTIPYGKTTTYGAIAKSISPAMSAQAVGQAVGKNPISIIIPCHRCIGANGKLTGYAVGLEKKAWLLRHEEVTQ